MTLPHEPVARDAAAAGRADRLLHGMHRIVNHDLPNQLVVLQGLLQMLDLEEADRLSADGREYLQRLLSVAHKATGLVRVLKEMGRIHDYKGRPEAVTLATLARELQGELSTRCPQRPIEVRGTWDVPVVVADARSFHQAVLELLLALVERSPEPRCRMQGASHSTSAGTEVSFRAEIAAREPPGAPAQARPALPAETLLAREWLAASGATLVMADDGFTILLPAVTPHG